MQMHRYSLRRRRHRTRRARVVLLISLPSSPVFCQQADPAKNAPMEPESKRIFWIIPNFRTSPLLASNILKELWPDLMRKFSRKHKSTDNGSF
jgi:hypothetical protein